jgi:hypothetical protein
MARIQSVSPDLLHSGLDKVISMATKTVTPVSAQFVSPATSKEYYYKILAAGGFPVATTLDEAHGVNFTDWQVPFRKSPTFQTYAMGWAVSYQTEEADYYGMMKRRAKDLMMAVQKAYEYDCASFLNLATAASFTSIDNVSFANVGHPIATGTFSNILSGSNLGLNPTSLAAAIAQLQIQPEYSGGMPYMNTMTVDLLVPPALSDLAHRIVRSGQIALTNNNDPNYVGSQVRKIVVNPLFAAQYGGSDTAWMIVSTDADNNPMLSITRGDLNTRVWEDNNFLVMKHSAWRLWRNQPTLGNGIVYSPGA